MQQILVTGEGVQRVQLSEPGEYLVELAQEGVEVEIYGGWETRGHQEVEIRLEIRHRARHTRSRTLLRGVAHDQSRLVLSGTIVVEPDAQDTNAFLTENVLLLSPQARAEAVPNLEISANEVKCSHAATISSIPEEHLFYLMTRGLNRIKAEELIIQGFLGEVQQK